MKVSIIGAGRVGLTLGALLAENGHFILFTDKDTQKLKNLSKGKIPFYEPGLKSLLQKNKKRLKWIKDTDIVTAPTVIFLTLSPKVKSNGDLDLSGVKDWVHRIIRNTKKEKFLILKSTLPLGTNHYLQSLVIKKNVPLHVITCPEFLRQGQGLKDIQNPERIVIASHSPVANKKIARLYKTFSSGPILFTSPEAAEMGKLAANSFLTLKISFINLMANVMENLSGIKSNEKFLHIKNRSSNMKDLQNILSSDKRIGAHFLQSGLGFGGSCLPKDLSYLILQGQKVGISMNLLKEVNKLNYQRVDHFLQQIKKYSKTIKNKTYAFWGISFKQGTDDLKFSPAFLLAERLLKDGAKISVFDPLFIKKKELIISLFPTDLKTKITVHDTPLSAVKSAHGLIIGTDWKGFQKVSLKNIKKHLKKPFIVDGRAVCNVKKLKEEGFDFYQAGFSNGD